MNQAVHINAGLNEGLTRYNISIRWGGSKAELFHFESFKTFGLSTLA